MDRPLNEVAADKIRDRVYYKRVGLSVIDWESVSSVKLWGHVSLQQQATIYMLVGVSEIDKCVSVTQW